MAAQTAAARQAANFARHSTSKLAATSTQSSILKRHRGFAAGGVDNHGPPKVNFWEDLVHPSKWKEEHGVVLCILVAMGIEIEFSTGNSQMVVLLHTATPV